MQYKNLVRSTTEKGIKKWLKRYPSDNILFHHRFPTSTDNVKNACHPFSTGDFFKTNYVLVHNGHISNDDKLRQEHEARGIKYYSMQPDGFSFNDSEALLWDIALYLEGEQTELKATGNIAFICMAMGKGNQHDRLYFGRNSNPLNMKFNDHILMLSSEGKGEPIEQNTLYNFDYKTRKLETKPLEIPQYVYTTPTVYGSGYTAEDYYEYEEEYETSGYSDSIEQMADRGLGLVRISRMSHVAKQIDLQLIHNRIFRACDGWYNEVFEQLQFEYDCLSILYDKQASFNLPTIDIRYTLDIYEELEDKLDTEYTDKNQCNLEFNTQGGKESE